MFLLVPAYPGCPGQTAVKWLLLLLWLFWGKLCQDGCGVYCIHCRRFNLNQSVNDEFCQILLSSLSYFLSM